MSEALATFPVRIRLPVLWGDMDAYDHVNNTVYFRWFECARIEYFQRIGLDALKESRGIGGILADTRCRFKAPLSHPDHVWVGGRVAELDEDRFTMAYAVHSERLERVAAEGTGLIVCYDYRRGARAALPDDLRRRIRQIEGTGCPGTRGDAPRE